MSNTSAPHEPKKYTRIALKEQHIIVAASPLDIVPPSWSHFISSKNFGGPKRADRLQQILDGNPDGKSGDPNNHYLLCTILGSDDSDITGVMATGIKEGKDVAIWILSNFNGRNSNRPFYDGKIIVDGEDGEGAEEVPEDNIADCHRLVSSEVIVNRKRNEVMHLVGTIGIRSKTIENAIDAMPEDLFEHVATFQPEGYSDDQSSISVTVSKLTKREKVRFEIIKALIHSHTEMVQTFGPAVIPSLSFANSGVVISTTEASPLTRKKDYSSKLALASFPVFAGKHIMRVNEVLTSEALVEKLCDGDLVAANIGDLEEYIKVKSAEVGDRITKAGGKPDNPSDLSFSFFLGSISQRYIGTRVSAEPPPIFWCMFCGFVGWTTLAKVFANTDEAFDQWTVGCDKDDLEIIGDDTSSITFGSVDSKNQVTDYENGQTRILTKDGEVSCPIPQEALERLKDSLAQAALCKKMLMAYLDEVSQPESLKQITNDEQAIALAVIGLEKIRTATNNFDKAPDAETGINTAQEILKVMKDVTMLAVGCKTPEDFIEAVAKKLHLKNPGKH
jgi:hypothetical protein